MSDEQRTARVFISYSRANLDFADQLVAGLEAAGGFEVLIDRAGIGHGEDWQERLGRLILECDTMVFVLSPESVASDVCGWEVEEARRHSKRIIPVLWKTVDFAQAPKGLSAINAVPFNDANAVTGLPKLVDALNSDLDWLREHTRLGERAAEWDRAGRTSEFLLRGAVLKSVDEWQASRPATAPEITQLQRAYIQASEEEETRILSAERERLKQVEAAKEAAEAAQRETEAARESEAAAARSVVRRTTAGLLAALALLIVSGVLGWNAYQSQQTAEGALAAADQARAAAVEAEGRQRLAREEADRNAEEAERLAQEFALTAYAAQEAESRFLGGFAQELLSRGDASGALHLAYLAMPNPDEGEVPIFEPGAVKALRDARYARRELRKFDGLEQVISAVALSPDGARVAAADSDARVAIWSASSGEMLGSASLPAFGKIVELEFSPNGETLAVLDERDGMRLLSGRDASELVELETIAPILAFAFTADGRSIVTGDWKGVATKYALPGGEIVARETYGASITSIAISPDENVVAFGGTSGQGAGLAMWRIEEGLQQLLENPEAAREPSGLRSSRAGVAAFSPNGGLIAFGTSDGDVELYDVGTRELVEVLTVSIGPIVSLEFSRDGGRLLAATLDGVTRLFQEQEGARERNATLSPALRQAAWTERVRYDRHDGAVVKATFVDADRGVATHGADGTVRLSTVEPGVELAMLRDAEDLRAMGASADGAVIATGDAKGIVRLWSARGPVETRTIGIRSLSERVLGISVDGRSIVVTQGDAGALAWRVTPNGSTPVALNGATKKPRGALISADGSTMLASDSIGPIQLWSLEDGVQLPALETGDARIMDAAIAATGAVAAASMDDGLVRLWSTADGSVLHEIPFGKGALASVALSPDGALLAVATNTPVVGLWSVETGEKVGDLEADGPIGIVRAAESGGSWLGLGEGRAQVWSAETRERTAAIQGFALQGRVGAFSADGRVGLTQIADKQAQIWLLETGEAGAVLRGHRRDITSAALSPDGEIAATGDRSGAVRLWWTRNGAPLAEFRAHAHWTTELSFTPDGSRLISGGSDGAAAIWPLWRDEVALQEQSRVLVERLEPLTTAERCRYYQEPDEVCAEVAAAQ